VRAEATSWRGLVPAGAYWSDYDAVVVPNRGARASYEVYTYGEQVAARPRLDEAKAAVEDVYGPLSWRLVQLPKEEAVHYYFGPTTEFTDPTSIWVVDHLPRLGARGLVGAVGRVAAIASGR